MDGSPFPSSQSMASPAASNWPGSPSMPRPSPARPGQSPGNHPIMHSPQADHKTGNSVQTVITVTKFYLFRRKSHIRSILLFEAVFTNTINTTTT